MGRETERERKKMVYFVGLGERDGSIKWFLDVERERSKREA
jgi:hypothetical protein